MVCFLQSRIKNPKIFNLQWHKTEKLQIFTFWESETSAQSIANFSRNWLIISALHWCDCNVAAGVNTALLCEQFNAEPRLHISDGESKHLAVARRADRTPALIPVSDLNRRHRPLWYTILCIKKHIWCSYVISSMNKKNAFNQKKKSTFAVVLLSDRVQSGLRAQTLMWLLLCCFFSSSRLCVVQFYSADRSREQTACC